MPISAKYVASQDEIHKLLTILVERIELDPATRKFLIHYKLHRSEGGVPKECQDALQYWIFEFSAPR